VRNRFTQRRARRGFTLLEVTVSTLLVGTILVGSLSTIGSVLRQRTRTADDLRGMLLAEQLLAEILTKEYAEPTEVPLFGAELSELLSRANFDDVDDYHGWDRSPPEDRSGKTLDDLSGWRRRVRVEFVDPFKPSSPTLDDRGAKRVTVEVLRDGRLQARLRGLKTDA
jgi:MSHA pilin protein MshD